LPTWPYATEDWMDRIVVTGVIVAPLGGAASRSETTVRV
jgi:hypothetical protein